MTKFLALLLPSVSLFFVLHGATMVAQQQPAQCPPDQVVCASTNGATYEQTRDWIIKTLANVAGSSGTDSDGGTGELTYSNFSMDGCHFKFSFHKVYTPRNGKGLDYSQDIDVSLASVNRVTVARSDDGAAPGSEIGFITATTAVNHQGSDGSWVSPGWKEWNDSGTVFFVGQPDVDAESYASRLQKAFVHAAALCRAQAAQQPSNEPF